MISSVVIVHGSNRTKEKAFEGGIEKTRHWFSWLKKELKSRGIFADVSKYPRDWNPSYEKWKEVLEKNNLDENSVLVGHSAGGGFLVRWLGETKKKVKKLILVAPAILHGEEIPPFEDLLRFQIDSKVKDLVKEIIIYVSDNERGGIKKAVKIFSEALNVKPIVMKNHGHFTLSGMGTREFPELLEKILE